MNIYTWNTLKSINVYIHDIEYDLEGINGYKNYDKSVTNGLTKEQQLAELPECLTFHHKVLSDPWGENEQYENKEDFIDSFSRGVQKIIESEYHWLCMGFKFHLKTEKYGEFDHTFKEATIKECMDNHKFFSLYRLNGCKQTVDDAMKSHKKYFKIKK